MAMDGADILLGCNRFLQSKHLPKGVCWRSELFVVFLLGEFFISIIIYSLAQMLSYQALFLHFILYLGPCTVIFFLLASMSFVTCCQNKFSRLFFLLSVCVIPNIRIFLLHFGLQLSQCHLVEKNSLGVPRVNSNRRSAYDLVEWQNRVRIMDITILRRRRNMLGRCLEKHCSTKYSFLMSVPTRHGGLVVNALDCWPEGRGIESRP